MTLVMPFFGCISCIFELDGIYIRVIGVQYRNSTGWYIEFNFQLQILEGENFNIFIFVLLRVWYENDFEQQL